MKSDDYRNLIVWQKSMDLLVEIYKLVKKLPKEEIYSLSDQIRRAVVSIPSNIAEGQARNSSKEFYHFLCVARGSLAELETQLIAANRIGYFKECDLDISFSLLSEIKKMLSSLLNKLKTDD